MKQTDSIDAYIAASEESVRSTLEQLRQVIRSEVPDAIETISYGMPTFRLGGKNLMHFAAFPHHIGVYATPDAHEEFKNDLSKYRRGKGSVQFPLDGVPLELVARMARFRAEQLNERSK